MTRAERLSELEEQAESLRQEASDPNVATLATIVEELIYLLRREWLEK